MVGEWDVRIDPWAVEYGAETPGVAEPAEQQEEDIDLDVERPGGAWREMQAPADRPDTAVFFVDGVRRIEARLVVTRGARVIHGALGSFGVGAVRAERRRASFVHERVGRLLMFGSGQRPAAPLELGQGLTYAPRSVADADPDAPLRGLHEDMRVAESVLAAHLAADGSLVVADGPLSWGTGHLTRGTEAGAPGTRHAAPGTVVGFVKRLFRTYLPADHLSIVRRLSVGARTPVFLIRGRFSRYSWFTRLGAPLRAESDFTGIVRLEVPEAVGADQAIWWATTITGWLPAFVPPRSRDPRAPQNLVPIGALERHLRHRLGDERLIRRRLATLLARDSTHA